MRKNVSYKALYFMLRQQIKGTVMALDMERKNLTEFLEFTEQQIDEVKKYNEKNTETP